MSFATNTAGILITDLADETAEIIDEVPREAQNGWDSMQITLLHRSSAAGNDPNALLTLDALYDTGGTYERGANPFGDMFVVDRSPRLAGPSIFLVDITLQGILGTRGYKITYDNALQQQTGQNMTAPDPNGTPTAYAKIQTREAQVTAVLEYPLFSADPTDPGFLTAATATSGLVNLPAGWEPAVPSSVWASLTDFTYHYPNGWVFDGATMQNLGELNSVFWVREKYVYQQPYSP